MTTEEYVQGARWTEFHFYASGKANGWEIQSLAPGVRFKIQEVRLHFTSAFASIEDLVMYNSSILGLGFSQILLSQALSDVSDLVVEFTNDEGKMFFSDDQIIFTASMVSNTTTWGLEVIGWSVRG